jgi:hypothetical protein
MKFKYLIIGPDLNVNGTNSEIEAGFARASAASSEFIVIDTEAHLVFYDEGEGISITDIDERASCEDTSE